MFKDINYVEASDPTITATIEATGETFVVNQFTVVEPYATYYSELVSGIHGPIGPVQISWGTQNSDGTICAPTRLFQPPESLSSYQLHSGLYKIGLYDKVEAAVKEAGGLALIGWNYATSFNRRGTNLIPVIQSTLGWDDETMDDFFLTASRL